MTKDEERFIKDVGRLKQTTDEENRQLVIQYQSGDKRALTKLTQGIIKMVCKQAEEQWVYHSLYCIHDLIAAGCLGIEHAARLFNPDAGVKFSTYAYWWIRKYQFKEKMSWGLTHVSLDAPQVDSSGNIMPSLGESLSTEDVEQLYKEAYAKKKRKKKSNTNEEELNEEEADG